MAGPKLRVFCLSSVSKFKLTCSDSKVLCVASFILRTSPNLNPVGVKMPLEYFEHFGKKLDEQSSETPTVPEALLPPFLFSQSGDFLGWLDSEVSDSGSWTEDFFFLCKQEPRSRLVVVFKSINRGTDQAECKQDRSSKLTRISPNATA